MDQVRLIVVAAGGRGGGPIYFRALADGSNYALKSAESGEQLRGQSDAAVKFAEQMFMTDSDLFGDPADPCGIGATLNHAQGVIDRTRRLSSGASAFRQPRFKQIESRIVGRRFAEAVAQSGDLGAEDRIELHDLIGKFAERDSEDWPRTTRAQSNTDEIDVTNFVDDDRFRSFT